LESLKNTDKLLIFRSAGIGDFLVILPFINYLINVVGIKRENIIFVIINKYDVNPLKLLFLENDPLVINSIVLNQNNGFLKSLNYVKQCLKGKSFSKVIYLPFINEPISSKIKKYIAIKYIIKGNKTVYGLNFKKNNFNIGTQYLTYFEQLNLNNFKKYLNFNFKDITAIRDDEYTKINYFEINNGKKNIALYINSKLTMKIWNRENYKQIIEYIQSHHDVNIYLVGGQEDIEYNDAFIEDYKLKEVYNLAGEYSIRETILLFDKFELLIGNDGSPLHMAAYSSCSILGIYTYKEEVTSWEPYSAKNFIIIRKNVSCKHCYLEFCENVICLEELNTIDVLQALKELLSLSQPLRQTRIIL